VNDKNGIKQPERNTNTNEFQSRSMREKGANQGMLPPKLLTVKEVSAITGLAPDTIYKMISQRRIPFVRVGRLRKFRPKDIETWIDQQSVEPIN
jgi:excisionase family DNA binding protein